MLERELGNQSVICTYSFAKYIEIPVVEDFTIFLSHHQSIVTSGGQLASVPLC